MDSNFECLQDGIYVIQYSPRRGEIHERLTNFTVSPIEIAEVHSSCGTELYICIKLENAFGTTEYWLSLAGIDSFNPSDVNPAFALVNPSKPNRRLFASYLRSEVENLKGKPIGQKFLVDQLGDICIDGKYFFATGDALLGTDYEIENIIFSLNISKFIVEKTDISEDVAYNSFYQLCEIEPTVSTPLGLYVLSTFGREIYRRADLPEAGSPFLVGHSQSRKTTLATLATSFYQHTSNFGLNKIRLDSTTAGISRFTSSFRGCCVVADDNFRSGSKNTRLTVQSLLRQQADQQERITAVSTSSTTGTGLVFTSEYLLDRRTDMARTQVLMVDSPVNAERLTGMQNNIDSLVCFYKNFVNWIYKKHDSVLSHCQSWADKLKVERTSTDKPWQRADDHRFVAQLSASLYIKYGVESGFVSESQADYLREFFSKILLQQCDFELYLNNEISRRSGENRIDIPKAILSLYNNDEFPLGTKECFVRVISNIELLYIFPEVLAFKINSVFGYCLDKKFYLKQLSLMGTLITEPNRGNVKRYHGKDYAVIRLDRLRNYSQSLNSLIDQYMA